MTTKKYYSNKTTEIQSPFLCLFLLYYGNLSIPLRQIYWNKWKSVLSLAWKVFLITGLYYIFYYGSQAYYLDPRLVRVFQKKPFYSMIYMFGRNFVYRYSFILNLGYFVGRSLFGKDDLVYHLVSFQVDAFDSKRKSIKLILTLLLVDHSIFVLPDLARILLQNNGPSSFLVENLIQWLKRYILGYIGNHYTAIPFILILYYKYCTVKELKGLYKSLENRENLKPFSYYEHELQRLAKLNCRLNKILSFPLFISISNYVVRFVLTLSCTFIHEVQMEFYCHLIKSAAYLIGVAHLVQKVDVEFMRLCRKLQENVENRLFKSGSAYGNLKGINNFPRQLETNKSLEIRCKELVRVYRSNLRLKLFDMCRVDFGYVCAVGAFVSNYVALIIQTSL